VTNLPNPTRLTVTQLIGIVGMRAAMRIVVLRSRYLDSKLSAPTSPNPS